MAQIGLSGVELAQREPHPGAHEQIVGVVLPRGQALKQGLGLVNIALGQRAAAAAARRAWGDALALGGAWAEAEITYALALREHARVADLRGARRCLTRLLDLNRAGDDTARALELLVLLDAIDAEGRQDDDMNTSTSTDTAR